MKFFTFFLLIFIILFNTGCGGSSDSSPSTKSQGLDTLQDIDDAQLSSDTTIQTPINSSSKIDEKYYGKWSYVHNGESVNILSTTDLNISEVSEDENLLKVHANNTTYYLVRSSISNTQVTGKIETQKDSNLSHATLRQGSGYAGIGGINIILSNVLDKKIQEKTITEDDGSFHTRTLPTGLYNLKASSDNNKLETQIKIVNKENDIGTFKLTGNNINNFKAELIINEKYIFANSKTYEAILRVHNISEQIGYGLTYDISLNTNDFVKNFNELSADALGSVQAHKYKDIPISLSFNPFSTNTKQYGLNVQIRDALGNKWIDTFTFTVYKEEVAIIILAKSSSIKGYIKNPLTGELTKINTNDGKILVPLMPENKPYLLVLSNPSFDDETAYSIGVNVMPNSFEGFKDTPAHEPNNNENEAVSLNMNDSIISYLHATDIDYWKIYTNENISVDEKLKNYVNASVSAIPSQPTNITASDGEFDNLISISWNPVANATYYDVYQSSNTDGNYTKINSEKVTTSNFNVTNLSEGTTYFYKVKACNQWGCSLLSSSNSGSTKVKNKPPHADAGPNRTITEGETITLQASKLGSYDPDGTIVFYEWYDYILDENAVATEELLSTQDTFSSTNLLSVGIHRIILRVTDDKGATDDTEVFITVNSIIYVNYPITTDLRYEASIGLEKASFLELQLPNIANIDNPSSLKIIDSNSGLEVAKAVDFATGINGTIKFKLYTAITSGNTYRVTLSGTTITIPSDANFYYVSFKGYDAASAAEIVPASYSYLETINN